MKGVNTGSSLDIDLSIIYSDEDTHKEAEDSEESLEEAAVNISEAQTDNAETNSQPEIVKLNSVSSSSTMKEEMEFWSSYLGKIKKRFSSNCKKIWDLPNTYWTL